MPSRRKLIAVLEEIRRFLALPDNDFSWSSWEDAADALDEIDNLLFRLRVGIPASRLSVRVLFAPTGPIQEVSLSSGWGDEFIEIAHRFDDAMAAEDEDPPALEREPCSCLEDPSPDLALIQDLGMDSRFAEVSVWLCPRCGRPWLRYGYEAEGFTGSGRWYLGAITPEQAISLLPEQAKETLEQLEGYFYGGCYYDGRNGKASGEIVLVP